jgi:protein-disulfide isomerase
VNRKILFIGAAALLGVAFVVGTLVYKSERTQQSTQTAERNQGALVRFHSPTLGNPDAKVHIVEFLDPACETCRSFYPHVKQIMAANPDKIRLSVRHVPFHSGSDYVVKVLEAAKKQGKYWQALEAVLASQANWVINHKAQPDRVWPSLEGLGLNFEQLKVDMNAPEVAQRLEQDLEDAKSLNVTKTPEFFVNGRPLPRFGLEELQGLVKEALQAAY